MIRPEDHLALVYAVANRLRRQHDVEWEDMVGDGMVALVAAAQTYDPSRGYPFRLDASVRIHGAVIDGLRRRVRNPRRPTEVVLMADVPEPAPVDGPEDEVERRARAAAVRAAIVALPAPWRETVEAMSEEGGARTLAHRQGVTEAAVSHRRPKLRRRLWRLQEWVA